MRSRNGWSWRLAVVVTLPLERTGGLHPGVYVMRLTVGGRTVSGTA